MYSFATKGILLRKTAVEIIIIIIIYPFRNLWKTWKTMEKLTWLERSLVTLLHILAQNNVFIEMELQWTVVVKLVYGMNEVL